MADDQDEARYEYRKQRDGNVGRHIVNVTIRALAATTHFTNVQEVCREGIEYRFVESFQNKKLIKKK